MLLVSIAAVVGALGAAVTREYAGAGGATAMGASATSYAKAESARRARTSALGYWKRTNVLPQGTSPTLTYTLHVGCENAESGFFDDIQEARIVRHNFGDDELFFEWEHGIEMRRENLFPGDTGTFSVDTAEVDWEWGFAVKNSAGEIRYEVGKKDDGAPLGGNDVCANSFGDYTNRIIGWDSRMTTEPGYIDYVFGSCARNCIPTGDPASWSPEEKAKNAKKMLANPPKGLGSAFKMYGVAGNAWCTINIHTQRGASDDIMMVFNPRSRSAECIMDVATNCKPAITDPNGECNWAGARESAPWNNAEMGTVQSTDMNQHWAFEFTYLTDGVGITLNGKSYYTYKWRSSDGGYDSVSYIQMNGGQPDLVYKKIGNVQPRRLRAPAHRQGEPRKSRRRRPLSATMTSPIEANVLSSRPRSHRSRTSYPSVLRRRRASRRPPPARDTLTHYSYSSCNNNSNHMRFCQMLFISACARSTPRCPGRTITISRRGRRRYPRAGAHTKSSAELTLVEWI